MTNKLNLIATDTIDDDGVDDDGSVDGADDNKDDDGAGDDGSLIEPMIMHIIMMVQVTKLHEDSRKIQDVI